MARLSEPRIKAAILHPEEEVRLTALRYFTQSRDRNPSIMPVVIEAVEKHGRENAFRILRNADALSQTPDTMEWLIGELSAGHDVREITWDNHCFAVGLILCNADAELLEANSENILSAPLFPDELRSSFSQRVEQAAWPWDRLWQELLDIGRKSFRRAGVSFADNRRIGQWMREAKRRRDEGGEVILGLLSGEHAAVSKRLAEWMAPWIVEAAGVMRLEEAIPHVIGLLRHGQEHIQDVCPSALANIGGDAVTQAITDAWKDEGGDEDEDTEFRRWAV
ncbi:MAG: hypothetical protein N2C14_01635, partial [Planctomycetales bacterium]